MPAPAFESGRRTPPSVARTALLAFAGKGSRETCSTGFCKLCWRMSSSDCSPASAHTPPAIPSPLATATPPDAIASVPPCIMAARETPNFGNRTRDAHSCRNRVPTPIATDMYP